MREQFIIRQTLPRGVGQDGIGVILRVMGGVNRRVPSWPFSLFNQRVIYPLGKWFYPCQSLKNRPPHEPLGQSLRQRINRLALGNVYAFLWVKDKIGVRHLGSVFVIFHPPRDNSVLPDGKLAHQIIAVSVKKRQIKGRFCVLHLDAIGARPRGRGIMTQNLDFQRQQLRQFLPLHGIAKSAFLHGIWQGEKQVFNAADVYLFKGFRQAGTDSIKAVYLGEKGEEDFGVS